MRYAVLSFLCMATVIAYVQRSALGVPSKTIEAELGLGPQDMGLIMSRWYWLYALCQLPAGWITDRLGSRLFAHRIRHSLVISDGNGWLATGFPMLLLLWGTMGVAQSGMFPCASKSIGSLFPQAGRAFASGSLGCCMAIGWMISPRITSELLLFNSWQKHLRTVRGARADLGVCLRTAHSPVRRTRPNEKRSGRWTGRNCSPMCR